ncbi:MliC family protein [Azoarcus sp. DN11]|uniref:MliC family protein n=1 Tax=Azoarcus sp. DN11 TaxID=356837 RepID=UPI000EB19534|nr:MliC family protein [Azoarcus sp. DN11]AYH44865.1 hypothetical protein CDA09_15980 [Azoarcus sp. DN11]
MTARTFALGPLASLLAALIAGCAQAPTASRPVEYACDAGKGFSVAYHAGGDATIDIEGMRFGLMKEAASGGEERYACGALTLWRRGSMARVDLENSLYENCHARD